MTQPALFELDTDDTTHVLDTDDTTHVLMPSMGYACGASMLDVGGRFTVGLSDWARIDCPGCLDRGQDAIRAQIDREQRDQA